MVQPVKPKKVIAYQDKNGKEPFTDWLNGLRDQKGQGAILRRTVKLEEGLYGDCKPVGEGVSELRITTGPDTGFILAKRTAISLSSYAAAIKALRART